MSQMPRLAVEGLNKAFSGGQVLYDVSFEAYSGEVLGLVGENGSGKSTTMNILAGVLTRDSGRMLIDGMPYSPRNRRDADGAGVSFIQQELSIFPNLSAAENLFLGRFPYHSAGVPLISRSKMRRRAKELLRGVDLDFDPDAAASKLSPGERQLLEIARALGTDSRIMIFDEPTTSLTQRETERLFEIIDRLRLSGVAILYISHNLEDVLRISDRIVVMRGGRVMLRAPSKTLSAHDLVIEMVGHSIATLFPERKQLTVQDADGELVSNPVSTPPVLEVEKVGEPGVVHEITFQVHEGEIVGLAGLMGAGRSELARILFGIDPHIRGTIKLRNRSLLPGDIGARIDAGMALLTEDRRHEGLMMSASVAENMALAALPTFARGLGGQIHRKPLMDALQRLASRLNIKSGRLLSVAVRTLSGGNQQKVVLGRWLLRKPALFILDEPTRGVDIGAKEEIYRLLVSMADQGMAVLVISSEIEELTGLADRILVMCRGEIHRQFVRSEFDRELILKAAFGQGKAA